MEHNMKPTTQQLKFVTVNRLFNLDLSQCKGIQYLDMSVDVTIDPNSAAKTTKNVINGLSEFITDSQSIILNRSDLLEFADAVKLVSNEEANDGLFNKIRHKLRDKFDVCKIGFNPRTLVLNDRTFIIHCRHSWS